MAKIIHKNHLAELANELKKFGKVLAPIEKHAHSGASKIVFSEYSTSEKLELDYPTTVLPPKEFLLPPEETLFEFKNGNTNLLKTTKMVIFGVSYEDLEGLAKLKKIFEKPPEDEPFVNRAKATIIIATDRFSPPKNIAFDVYLQKLSHDRYAAFAGSAIGQKILRSSLFKYEKVSVPRVTKAIDPLLTDPNLAKAIVGSKKSKIWDELAKECFACGICSFTCPLCYCFETEDRTNLPQGKEPTGKRTRQWSTCFSEDFASTTAHNFRPERRDRIYNWYFHKFVRMPAELGFSGCVDCNRCVIFCPAKINYRKILEKVLAEYQEKQK